MKVALLFSGQLRQIHIELFKKSLSTLTKDMDCSIFSYCWKEQGKSLNHKENISDLSLIENIDEYINYIFQDFNLVNYGYESFNQFKQYLPISHKNIYYSNRFHFGTVNSLPQVYTLHKCFKLLEQNENEFDLIFRCRYDSIFIHPLKSFPLWQIIKDKRLYNLNFGRAYYPNRVYDIFFGGSRKSMNFLSNIWSNLPFIVDSKFNNGLDKRDCCRILYISAILDNTKVKSFDSRICDVYRNNKYEYMKSLVSSHLVKIKLNFSNFIVLIFIFKWLKENNLINIKILILFLKSFFIIPFSYLKRIKYIKNLSNLY